MENSRNWVKRKTISKHIFVKDDDTVGYGFVEEVTEGHTINRKRVAFSQQVDFVVGQTGQQVPIDDDIFNELNDPTNPLTFKDLDKLGKRKKPKKSTG